MSLSSARGVKARKGVSESGGWDPNDRLRFPSLLSVGKNRQTTKLMNDDLVLRILKFMKANGKNSFKFPVAG